MGEPAARHAAQARDEAGVMTFPRLAAQSTRVRIVQLLEARGVLTSRQNCVDAVADLACRSSRPRFSGR